MEETEQSSYFINEIDEDIINEELFEKDVINNLKTNHPEQHSNTSCGCDDKACGRKCECYTIKEDIKILFSLGEFIDKIIANQKKAFNTPLNEHAKPYKLLDMVFELNLKFDDCICEKLEESKSSESGQSTQSNEPPYCQCPNIRKKRCVLRIIRNDVYQRMKLVRRLNFLLLENNKKIKEMIENKENDDPCIPYITRSVSYDEKTHKLIERCELLKTMKEDDVPIACLFDKKALLNHIGQDRILLKPLRHIYMLEELVSKATKKTQRGIEYEKCLEKAEISEEKEDCRCPEMEKKIEFIKKFKAMIGHLNPILQREEEMLDLAKSEGKTMEELIEEKRKDRQKLADLVRKRKEAVKLLKEQYALEEENRTLTDVIQMLMEYLTQMKAILHSYETNPEWFEDGKFELLDEAKQLSEFVDLLNKYKNRNEEPLDDEKSLLAEINRRLQEYLEIQRNYFDAMEKLISGFKIAIFDKELNKDRIVAEICKDDEKKESLPKGIEKSEEFEGRERFRTLLKGLNKPHLHVIGNPLGKMKTSQTSGSNGGSCSKPSIGSSKKKLISKLKNFKKKIEKKVSVELDSCHYDVLEKELLKALENLNPPLPKEEEEEEEAPPKNNNCDILKTKLKKMAFEEGRKIVSQPDPIIHRQEKLIFRKRLVRELGLKCSKKGPCCKEIKGSKKLILKAAYDTKVEKDCRCTDRLELLNRLEKDFENIILQPEKYNIDFVSGPRNFINKSAIKRMRAFIHKHATKMAVSSDSVTEITHSFTKTQLTTVYNDSCFSEVWKDFGERSGMFSVNLEAQMMENERIIIRTQYIKRVKVLSGGRTGLDPFYGEYVSTGMLDAVVLGDNAQGPIPRTILQAIKELDSGQGVVIIILNENDNRLSFLFAIEQARKLGIDAELVLARDDVSEHQEKCRYGPKGHIGIILQFKVAAAMAAKGYNLAAVARVSQGIQVSTLDCYFTKYGPIVGSGIRNESGSYIPGLQADDVLTELLKQLMDPEGRNTLIPEPGTKMILLVNKFKIIMDDVYCIISYVIKKILETGAEVARVYHGSFSAFKSQGFSLTLAKDWNDELIQFLDFPTTCLHWPPHLSGSREFIMNRTRIHEEPIIGSHLSDESYAIVFEIVDRTCRKIAYIMDSIMACNMTIAKSLQDILWILKPNLPKLPVDRPFVFFYLVGKLLNANLPIIGKQFNLILVAAAQEFMGDPDYEINWVNWCRALKRGVESFAGYTRFKPGDGTIIDYLVPISDALCDIQEGWNPLAFLFDGLEKVNHLQEERKYDVGILLLSELFNNVYECSLEFFGHCPTEAWWKVRCPPQILLVNQSCQDSICHDVIPEEVKKLIKEQEKKLLAYPSPQHSSVYSVKEEKKTEPSIEAGLMEEDELSERDTISIRSAAGVIYENLRDHPSEESSQSFSSISEVSSSWKYL